jgi:hypothetical protein
MGRDDVDHSRLAQSAGANAVKPREGEDVVAWIMRTRAMTFVDAVHYANELLREGDDA